MRVHFTKLLSVSRREYQTILSRRLFLIVSTTAFSVGLATTSLRPTTIQTLGGATPIADVQGTIALLVPFVAATFGYRAVVGERESGTIRILAGTRLSRSDIILGKIVGQTVATFTPVIFGTTLVVVVDIFSLNRFSVGIALEFVIVALIYTFAVVAIIVSISTLASSSVQSAVLIGITVLAGLLLWSDLMVIFLWDTFTGTVPGNSLRYPNIFELASRLSPNDAYYVLTNWILDVPIGTDSAVTQLTGPLNEAVKGEPRPLYLTPWFSLIPLVGWPFVLVLFSLRTFENRSLTVRPDEKFNWVRRLQIPWNRLSNWAPFGSILGRRDLFSWLPGRWQSIAQREFRILSRSPGIWLLGALIFVTSISSLAVQDIVKNYLGPLVPLAVLQTPGITLFAGSGAVFFTFRALSEERRSGSIRLTAGTKASRADVIIGVLIGRTIAFVIPVLIAIVLTCVVAIPQYSAVPLVQLLEFLAASVGFLFAMAAVGVAISTLSRHQVVVGGLAFSFVALPFYWEPLVNSFYSIVTGNAVDLVRPPQDPTYFLFKWLLPQNLYRVLTNWLLGVPNSSGTALFVTSDMLQQSTVSNITTVRSVFGTNIPVWYLHPILAVVGLMLLLGVSQIFSILVFSRSDLD
ncbi:ABC transporter permease subunit [Haladaptatus sp. DYF46]|uniref:ABC transporter permease n=1 Tax=Haladaptatus sp. DYF46 TaxID=2886041 RepID=UPI001E5DF868|nr:ABC transporter permease subunit [Haladaptatus sp. DYF46]